MMNLKIDTGTYPVPVDGNVDEEFERLLYDFLYDIDGVEIKYIKILKD